MVTWVVVEGLVTSGWEQSIKDDSESFEVTDFETRRKKHRLDAEQYVDQCLKYVFSDIKKGQGHKKVAIFSAGTPGSGKTELLDYLYPRYQHIYARLDPDDFRHYFSEYTGDNAAEFQPAIGYLLTKCFNYAKKHKYNFIYDSTFVAHSSLERVQKVINAGYVVKIVYTYSQPRDAWNIIQGRYQVMYLKHF
ncbi:zeta toxin family protein [Furfurilactobacillus siliginis]|uniref:UDP-N-acetylglucosamine kinase n=1 Tax=Furfurilactobacillus siliginis TaxID=348151 RepID=A0A0R2L140_9LACO|nr:zeta toxin family protein [Furfurilactobacillus siliginis]KRN95374.1 hypothetical protein IV55_GL002018 [Furfurilactobacillus siliginis]GEK28154.1 hypothetical protein LSI01_04650 [Furfurilactobacillus siliginis]